MLNAAFRCGSVRIVCGKKPGYSLLCAENEDGLSDGQRLRVMRLRAGLTIREAAEMVGICRHTLMNYESERTKVKNVVVNNLQNIFSKIIQQNTP